MNIMKKSGFAAVLAFLALSFVTSNIAKAESNPFSAQEIVTIAADEKASKCGEGKCGEGKAKKSSKCGEGKCGEGKAKKCGG